MSKYYATIGLEMHCEGSETNSKVFSPAKNEYSDIPNENVVAIDMGFPGILPVVNKEAVRMSIMMASVLHARIPEYMYFERKNYYYPDLPKGYQITQNPPEECVGNGGYIDIERDDESTFRVEIDNLHLEEDAARSTHLYDTTMINYNRAGAPLFELVTKPCIHSADDAVSFLEYIRTIYQYCGISEADAKKGQIRCDVNVSISEDENSLGTKVEMKNVNSFAAVRDAINYEIQRQSDLKDAGRYDEVVQETRRWDEESGTTITMRSKEDALDYKYFVDPNIPKYKIEPEWVKEIQSSIPELPSERKEKYINKLGLTPFETKKLIRDKSLSDYFEECLQLGINPKEASNWISENIVAYMNKNELEISDIYLNPKMLKFILDKLSEGTISSKQAKEVLVKVLDEKKEPSNFINKENAQISDPDELGKIIDEIISSNPAQVEQYRSGKDRIFDFFVGQVMKNTRGKANPITTKELLKEKLK
ncbi:MAG: Asp-tRNA(Asn)/Glu-tRNA(Gln) amidotransferase subunit GatB [Clostridia bacterium]|nr:Asp-tRNA(Asn)/Glu-tRNA(Gln) amidotransferase subunit GatB [Clostridia bacterium]